MDNPMKKDGGIEVLERKLANLLAVNKGVGRSGDLVKALETTRERKLFSLGCASFFFFFFPFLTRHPISTSQLLWLLLWSRSRTDRKGMLRSTSRCSTVLMMLVMTTIAVMVITAARAARAAYRDAAVKRVWKVKES